MLTPENSRLVSCLLDNLTPNSSSGHVQTAIPSVSPVGLLVVLEEPAVQRIVATDP